MKRNAFLLILLLVAPIAAFAQNTVTTTIQDTGDAIFYSFTEALRVFMAFIPRFLGALVILGIGWIVSSALAKMVAKGLKLLGVDRAVQAAGMGGVYERAKTRWTVSDILAFMIKWFIRLIFIQAAANILGMPQVTQVINSIVLFIPKMIVAVAILLIGSIAARFLSSVVESSLDRSGVNNSRTIGLFTRYVIIGFAVVAAVNQLEVAEVVVNTFYIALVGSMALAIGLAFGLGGREVAAEITRRWYDNGRALAQKVKDSENGEHLEERRNFEATLREEMEPRSDPNRPRH